MDKGTCVTESPMRAWCHRQGCSGLGGTDKGTPCPDSHLFCHAILLTGNRVCWKTVFLFLFYFILFYFKFQFSDLEAEPMVVIWWSIHEECARTDNSNCDRPLKVAPHSPNAFPVPFVTQSPPSTLILMHLQYPVLTIPNW